VRAAGEALARAQGKALGAGLGALGARGVRPAEALGGGRPGGRDPLPAGGGVRIPPRGGGSWDGGGRDACWAPWGFWWSGGRTCFGFSWWWDCWSPSWSWSWCSYYGWWYPYWYACYRPYYCSWPSYYSTVVYRTVYEEVPVYETVYVDPAEPVGEAVAPAAPVVDRQSLASDRYLTLGDQAFREGRYTDAVQFYAKAVQFAPGEGALHLVLADALFAAGDYHYAAYSIRKALELDPALAEAVVDKHAFYADPAEFDRQLAVLELYLHDHPTDRDARLVLALNYLLGMRAPDAVALLDEPASASLRDDPAARAILASARVRASLPR